MQRIALAISFGKTADRLLSKSVTRRNWKDSHAQKFIRAFEQNRQVAALDRDRRYGGKLIGWLTLTAKPYQERLTDMPDTDIALEGFPELTKGEFISRFFESDRNQVVWVIRFKFDEVKHDLLNS